MSIYEQGYSTTITVTDGPLELEITGTVSVAAERSVTTGRSDDWYEGGPEEWSLELESVAFVLDAIGTWPVSVGCAEYAMLNHYRDEAEAALRERAGEDC